jgi:hypothetical protein
MDWFEGTVAGDAHHEARCGRWRGGRATPEMSGSAKIVDPWVDGLWISCD